MAVVVTQKVLIIRESKFVFVNAEICNYLYFAYTEFFTTMCVRVWGAAASVNKKII